MHGQKNIKSRKYGMWEESTTVMYDVFLKVSPFSRWENAVLMALCGVRYNIRIRRGKGFFFD